MTTDNTMPARAGVAAESLPDDRNIFIAISSGKVNRLHSILASIEDLNIRDTSLRTPLIHAVFISNNDIRTHVVRLLLRHGCDVNAQDGVGRTALMYACMERDKMDVVRLLAKCRRCDPNVQDNDGNTALLHCVESGNASALRILANHSGMKSRLKVNQPNAAGLTAVELAVKLGLADCCRILIKDGGADTTRIKNRHILMEMVNQDRSRTPYDPNVTPSPVPLDDGDFMTPTATPRTAQSSDQGLISHRSDSETYTRTGSRHATGPDTPRPGSDYPLRPGSDFLARPGSDFPSRVVHSNSVLSLRKDISCEFASAASARPLSRDFHRLDGQAPHSNPFLEMVRQDSSLYVPNSRTTFRRTIIPKDGGGGRRGSREGKSSSSSMRRPLTPIASKTPTGEDSGTVTPMAGIPLPTRLPSIPSGKRVYNHNQQVMLSPCDTPTSF